MNSQSETLPRPSASPAPLSLAAPEPPPSVAPAPNRRNGKIPHLPKEHRDLINHYFDDGLTYQAVSRKLAEQGISINGANLSAWYNGGYQDHLRQAERCALLADSQQRLLDLALKHDAPALASVGLQLAVTQLAQQLADLAPGTHKDAFQNDSTLYLRMLNTLARMSKALLSLEQYHDACAQAVAAELKQMNTDRELADNEFQLVVKRMDRVFKVARPSSAASTSSGAGVPPVSPAAPRLPSGAGVPPVSPEASPPRAAALQFKVESSELDVQCSVPAHVGQACARAAEAAPALPSTQSPAPMPEPATCNPQPSTAEPVAPAAPMPSGASSPASVPKPATRNLQPATGSAFPMPNSEPIAQNSKLPCGAAVPNSQLSTLNSKLPPAPPSPASVPEPATCNQQPATPLAYSTTPHAAQPSTLNPQPSTSASPSPSEEETCYDCAVTLPPLLPTGQRPSNTCRRCGAKLYPPGTKFDHCPFCDAAQPLPNNERISPDCRRCGGVLPPPGQRYVENCPRCGLKLPNITNEGTRLSPRCSDCGALVPLLEPAPLLNSQLSTLNS